MLNDNFRRFLVAEMTTPTYVVSYKSVDGETYAEPNALSGRANTMTNIVGLKYSALVANSNINGASTLAFGSGDAAATKGDMCLAADPTQAISADNPSTLIDDTNFTVSSATRTNPNNQGLNNKCVLTQTYSYSGAEPITIREIGLMYKIAYYSGERYMAMIGREVLDSPITVNSGDTFSVSMTIG